LEFTLWSGETAEENKGGEEIMPSWLIDMFIVINTGLLIINLILLLLIWKVRRKESEKGGDGRNWSWDDKLHEEHLAARIKFEKKLNSQEKEKKNGNI
jgi:hypothetical protein